MPPLEHLLKYRGTMLQHRRRLAQLAAEDDGIGHAERIQTLSTNI